jgi:cell division protein FtsI (penicillin-binding protein 3)
MFQEGSSPAQPVKRIQVWYAVLLIIMAVFLLRLFYLQVLRYDHYKATALSDQLKQYAIPASRWTILAHSGGSGDTTVPIVLNQKLYVIFADPLYVKDAAKVADAVARVTGGSQSDIEDTLKTGMAIKGKRYVVLAKKVPQGQRDQITSLKMPGLGAVAQEYRTYPQGASAAQLLGFVNDDSKGTYGVEQALDPELRGTAGELRAITDVHGVPLAASPGNTSKPAVSGKDVVLTIDVSMQKNLEKILADGVQKVGAEGGSAVIIDPHSGAIKAMANVPSYDPSKYFDVSDAALFNNNAVARPIEVGSIMKPLTTAAALDSGAIRAGQMYYDPFQFTVNGFKITNIEEDGTAGTKTIADILNLSLNTGVTWELMQMGGGQINEKARDTWHDYMVNHYQFGKETGIEQGYEANGYVPGPKDNGAGINLTYANTAFGQAMTATPVQMAAALSSVVNGGTYYDPRLVDAYIDTSGKHVAVQSKVVRKGVVSAKVAQELIPMMQYTVDQHHIVPAFDQSRYTVGGKTGTAQIAKSGGGYLENDFNGTYMGFVGGDHPDYVITVFVNKPKVGKGMYAGTAAAQPIFAGLGHMLINNSYVTAKN